MGSQRQTADFVLEQMRGAGPLSARKMFGEFGLFCGDRLFALVCDDELYMKPTEAGRAYAPDLPEEQPFPRAKGWLMVSGDRLEEADWLKGLARATIAGLPPQKPKAARRKR
jgi:DNA transformation protein